MASAKLYPDLSQVRWANRCYLTALISFTIWLIISIGYFLFGKDYNHIGLIAFIWWPVALLIVPLEVILLIITLQSWTKWSIHRRRFITLFCSITVLILVYVELLLG